MCIMFFQKAQQQQQNATMNAAASQAASLAGLHPASEYFNERILYSENR